MQGNLKQNGIALKHINKTFKTHTMLDRKKDLTEDYFGNLPNAHILAKFKDGKLFDLKTEEPLDFLDGTVLKITANLKDIDDTMYSRFTQEIVEEILEAGSKLYFSLPYQVVEFSPSQLKSHWSQTLHNSHINYPVDWLSLVTNQSSNCSKNIK